MQSRSDPLSALWLHRDVWIDHHNTPVAAYHDTDRLTRWLYLHRYAHAPRTYRETGTLCILPNPIRQRRQYLIHTCHRSGEKMVCDGTQRYPLATLAAFHSVQQSATSVTVTLPHIVHQGFTYVDYQLPSTTPSALIWRFYFALRCEYVGEFCTLLQRHIVAVGLPCRYKVLRYTNAYPRADALTLYCDRRHHVQVKAVIQPLLAHTSHMMHALPPAYTYKLARGIGMAEQPSCGGSFGWHRMRLVAAVLTAMPHASLQEKQHAFNRLLPDPTGAHRNALAYLRWASPEYW